MNNKLSGAWSVIAPELRAFLSPLGWFIAGCFGLVAAVIGGLLTIIHFFWKRRVKSGFKHLGFTTWETAKGVTMIFGYFGYAIDKLCNVTCGSTLHRWCTDIPIEDTLFGKANYTMSAAMGGVQMEKPLFKKGQWISDKLDLTEPNKKNHCAKAFLIESYRQQVKENY